MSSSFRPKKNSNSSGTHHSNHHKTNSPMPETPVSSRSCRGTPTTTSAAGFISPQHLERSSWKAIDESKINDSYTPWNQQLAPENRPSPKRKLVFEPSIFRGEMLVFKESHGVFRFLPARASKQTCGVWNLNRSRLKRGSTGASYLGKRERNVVKSRNPPPVYETFSTDCFGQSL